MYENDFEHGEGTFWWYIILYYILGQIKLYIKEHGIMVYNMEKVYNLINKEKKEKEYGKMVNFNNGLVDIDS